MATRSTIMDTNSFRPEMADALDPATRKLTEERDVLGPAYRLFYRNPVHLVKGVGSHLWDADGEEYLDVYNNVASVGHCHPRVVEALSKQASMLNTHTRYLHENILHYAEDILSTMPDELDHTSGSDLHRRRRRDRDARGLPWQLRPDFQAVTGTRYRTDPGPHNAHDSHPRHLPSRNRRESGLRMHRRGIRQLDGG